MRNANAHANAEKEEDAAVHGDAVERGDVDLKDVEEDVELEEGEGEREDEKELERALIPARWKW